MSRIAFFCLVIQLQTRVLSTYLAGSDNHAYVYNVCQLTNQRFVCCCGGIWIGMSVGGGKISAPVPERLFHTKS